jgi:aminopeptidase N
MFSRMSPLVTLVCTLVLTATSTAHAARVYSDGIGDPYFPNAGNPGYDVTHYSIGVRYRPATGKLTGDTTIRLRPKTRLRQFNLDLLLRVDRVWVDGGRAAFARSPHEVTIKPNHPLVEGEVVAVRVKYHGKPAHRSYQHEHPFTRTATGAIAVGEPDIAAWWFPSNDHPSDKATYDISLTAPAGYEAISNGELSGHQTTGGLSLWHWTMAEPMATFLAFAAFGQYDVEQGAAAGIPYVYAWEHGLGAHARGARRSLRFTPKAIRFLTDAWGSYPFDSVGGVVPAVTLGYALENQGRPVYGRDVFRYGTARYVVVHELAHQWFGDRVALRRWKDIWLSEGFATYSEWLWEARQGGRTPQRRLLRFYHLFEANNPFWRLRIGDPGPERLFDEAVYDRGAMTVQALRNRVGTRDFFAISRRWTHAGDGVGSTTELKRLAEQVSREQLDGFFRHWLYVTEKPAATTENGL